jgi:hypothetical protein
VAVVSPALRLPRPAPRPQSGLYSIRAAYCSESVRPRGHAHHNFEATRARRLGHLGTLAPFVAQPPRLRAAACLLNAVEHPALIVRSQFNTNICVSIVPNKNTARVRLRLLAPACASADARRCPSACRIDARTLSLRKPIGMPFRTHGGRLSLRAREKFSRRPPETKNVFASLSPLAR